MNREFEIKKADDDLQIVFGEVYSPFIPDSQGDFMLPQDIRLMAHKFMQKLRLKNIDTQHDNDKNASAVVESFIARKDDVDFLEGAWVVGVFVPDPIIWKQIKEGDINGFSMQAMVTSTKRLVTLEVPVKISGATEEQNDHQHTFSVKFNDRGELLGGVTNEVNGHFHKILRGTATEATNDHTHRFSFKEKIDVPDIETGN